MEFAQPVNDDAKTRCRFVKEWNDLASDSVKRYRTGANFLLKERRALGYVERS
jgi:hypothetical protein